jgi:hypothetical protein
MSTTNAETHADGETSPDTPKTEQLNPLKGSLLFEGDIISPLEEKWDCEL